MRFLETVTAAVFLINLFFRTYSISTVRSPYCGLTDNHLSPSIFQLPLEITPLLC